MNVTSSCRSRKKLWKNTLSFYFCLSFFIIGSASCKKATSSLAKEASPQNNDQAAQKALKAFDEKPKLKSSQMPQPKFDVQASTLYGVQILEINAKEEQTDFDSFSYQISFEGTKTKQQGRFAIAESLPLMQGGRIQISVSGCIEDYRVIDEPCSKPVTQYIQVPFPANQASLPLLIQRYQLITQIQNLVLKVKDAIITWEKTATDKDQKVQTLIKNWRIYGETKNAAFYTSKEFKDMIFNPEGLSDLTKDQSLALTEETSASKGPYAEGNWAYPDGKIPQGKPTPTKRSEEEQALYQNIGTVLLLGGSITGTIGFIAMKINADMGESILIEYAVSLKRIQALEIVLAKRANLAATADTPAKKTLTAFHEELRDINAGKAPEKNSKLETLFKQATAYTDADLQDYNEEAFLKLVEGETTTNNFSTKTRGKIAKLHSKEIKEIEELLAKERQHLEETWEQNKIKLMSNLKSDPKGPQKIAAAANWESVDGGLQQKYGKWALIGGTLAAIVGVFAITASYDKVQLTEGTSGAGIQELVRTLNQIIEEIKEIFLKIEAIDKQLILTP